ncbi:MAG: HlyD family type I secretion periplasmic adaptor subunit [Pseudomonadota bacterium]
MAEALIAEQGRGASNPKRFFQIGWALIAFVFGGLVAWSIFAPFEGAVLTSGTISVESNRQAIQHLEGGIVGEIRVKEGDRVETGETLIVLDGTATAARLSSVEARLFELVGQETRLIAERDGVDDLALGIQYADLAARSEIQSILASQKELMAARATSRSTQVALLKQNMLQLRRRVDGLTNEITANQVQSDLIAEEVAGLEDLLARGLSPRSRVLALKRDNARLEGEREALISEVATTRIQIGEAEIEVNQLTDGFLEMVLTELRDVQTQIAELSEQRVSAMDQLRRLEINAPRAGRVLGVQTHTIGGVIGPGDPIMHIVPENDTLVALVRIAPQDIDKVSAGAEATLRFPAFSANATPEVQGAVSKVSADALQDVNTGALYFEGVIEIPDARLVDQTFQLLPGMPVDAQVRTESRTVLSYLLKPLGDAMSTTFRE